MNATFDFEIEILGLKVSPFKPSFEVCRAAVDEDYINNLGQLVRC